MFQDWKNEPLEDAAGQALTRAILTSQTHIIDLLVDVQNINLTKVDPETGLDCLAATARVGNLEVAQLLLKRAGLKLDSALLQAVEAGHEAVLDLLLSHGADLGVRDERGRSLLHIVASLGHCSILRRLLEARTDLDLASETDSEGLTPLTSAILWDQAEAAAVLLGHSGPAILEAGLNILAKH